MFGNYAEGCSSYELLGFQPAVWVNEDGVRFCNEDCADLCHDYTGTAIRSQKQTYLLFDESMISEMMKYERAEMAGMPGLVETFATYNEYCEAGADRMFGKNADYF